MMPIDTSVEEVVLEMLQRTGPCRFDDLVGSLPTLKWGQVFVAINRLSRERRVFLRQIAYSNYHVEQIVLPSHLESPSPLSRQQEAEV